LTLHYHGTPISPIAKFLELSGCCFTVSYARPDDVERAHKYGQSVMLDNGAFSHWRQGTPSDWPGYYKFCDRWLHHSTTWAVVPDTITGSAEDNDALIAEWPFGDRGAPVWHLHEPISRALDLINNWPLVCFGSSGKFSVVLAPSWCRRMDSVWNEIMRHYGRAPKIHMLRGMQLCRREWPFYSLDSTDIGRNHNRENNTPEEMARRWDSEQCPPKWISREEFALEGGFYERVAI
jgi:hypothetical protein